MLLGRGVTKTIKEGIIDAKCFSDYPEVLMYGMMCALLAAGLWLYVATYLEMPVSTTHSIIGCAETTPVTIKDIPPFRRI
jgi:solute carrier family 20 (sodium-dependent phosphate transporter)